MGPSGCGKSTLLGLLAGLAVPTTGIIRVGGEVVSAMSERQRVDYRKKSVGMVYQADNLLPFLTIAENVALQLAICLEPPATDAEASKMAAEPSTLLDQLGLADLVDRLPDQLSGGQRQRAAIARSVIHHPTLVLADEPTGSLDGESAQAVIDLLLDVQRRFAATLVLVTHDPEVASQLQEIVHLEATQPARADHVG